MIYRSCIRNNGTDCQAIYSDCELYRMRLSIHWDRSKPSINFLMLNPSTATERKNDPTVEGCEQRARAWGYGSLIVTNIFAFRATDPREMMSHPEPVGPGNDYFIIESARECLVTVAAWGNHGSHKLRGAEVRNMLRTYEIRPFIFAVNKTGEPKHPLYVARNVPAVPWNFIN